MKIEMPDILDKLTINKDQKKCFVFDLDGTIVFKNTMLSQVNEQIIQKIVDYGHEVIFATGRSYRDFKMVMPTKFYDYPLSLFSGALSRDRDGTICRNLHLPRLCVEEIVSMCLQYNSPFIMDNISHYYHPQISGATFGFIDSQVAGYRIINLDEIIATDIYKILVFDMSLYDLFAEYAKSNNLIIKHHSYDNCFDLVVNGCNKYDGVLPFISKYEASNVFAFGNDFNDYEMLLHISNSVVFGSITELQQISKVNLLYNDLLSTNFTLLIDSILHPN